MPSAMRRVLLLAMSHDIVLLAKASRRPGAWTAASAALGVICQTAAAAAAAAVMHVPIEACGDRRADGKLFQTVDGVAG